MLIRTALLALLLAAPAAMAQTQGEMNTDACSAYKAADQKLNEVYQAVLKKHRTDTALTTRLREAQRTWVKFRDAELAAI